MLHRKGTGAEKHDLFVIPQLLAQKCSSVLRLSVLLPIGLSFQSYSCHIKGKVTTKRWGRYRFSQTLWKGKYIPTLFFTFCFLQFWNEIYMDFLCFPSTLKFVFNRYIWPYIFSLLFGSYRKQTVKKLHEKISFFLDNNFSDAALVILFPWNAHNRIITFEVWCVPSYKWQLESKLLLFPTVNFKATTVTLFLLHINRFLKFLSELLVVVFCIDFKNHLKQSHAISSLQPCEFSLELDILFLLKTTKQTQTD